LGPCIWDFFEFPGACTWDLLEIFFERIGSILLLEILPLWKLNKWMMVGNEIWEEIWKLKYPTDGICPHTPKFGTYCHFCKMYIILPNLNIGIMHTKWI
jgi:hypothetical protein